jgi:hypothetical protein
MSKLTLIEKELHSINPAGFQRLCDSYLKKRGYKHINPLGLLIGVDKVVKGTPDTLIPRLDGKYDFVEYSTQQQGLASKFAGDIANCFDESKTGIPINRIGEIILCHNARLTSEEEYALREECLSRGVSISIYGPETIAQDLYQNYPRLARDFLGVEVDTGQIVSTDDFIVTYNKRSFSTRLDTLFKFREEELNQVARTLADKDLALVTGRPGIGKTRFALECCARYVEEHPDAKVFCIFNKGADLFEDLRVYFSEPGHFLIFVDDANRLSRSHFEYALQLLHDQRQDQKIRIIATVRDYALASVERVAKPFGGGQAIELVQFTDDQIKELVRDNSAILNPIYLDRIAEIAQGNPRLAMMAAQVAERENNLQSIADVSALYDEYFASIRDELDDLNNTSLILVAGIIAFFRVIDGSNSEMMATITDTFKIDADAFWQSAQRLHDLEVVDIYDKEIVKITDQVLSTYLFYLAAFRERALDLGILLERLFPAFRYRFIDALNPVLNAFDSEAITHALRPHVDRAYHITQQRCDEQGLLHLLDAFWFVKPTDTLIYLREKIDAMDLQAVPLSSLTFTISNNLPPSPSILGILDNFRGGNKTEVNAALSLTLDYLEKRPAELPIVLRMLLESYGMSHYSHFNEFLVERDMADQVWNRAQDGKNELFSRVFLTIAEPLLHTHFQTSRSKGSNAITIFDFDIPASKTLLEFRKKIWQRTLSLYSSPRLLERVLGVIAKHSCSGYLVANPEIIASDSHQILAFFESNLDPSIYSHCVVVQQYFDLLDRVGLEPKQDFRERFTNETYKLSELVLVDRRERGELGWREYETKQRERLAEYTGCFDEVGFAEFFERCAEIIGTADARQYEYEVQSSVVKTLLDLADRDCDLFVRVLQNYLQSGNVLNLAPWNMAQKLIQHCGNERAYDILCSANYEHRTSWLFAYFMALPEDAVTYERLQQLYHLYESAEWNEVLRGMDHLLKFVPLDKDVFVKVTRTLTTRCIAEPRCGHVLCDLFSEHGQAGNRLPELFAGEVDLLKQAYFAASEAEDHEDFKGHFFNELLNLVPNFGQQWVAQLYQRVHRPTRRDDSRDYSFIWRRPDFIQVMEEIAEAICTYGKGRLIYDSYLRNFFILNSETPDINVLHNRQDVFLDDIIKRRSGEEDLMMMLFEVISAFSAERRRGRFETFVRSNSDSRLFERLPMESYFEVYDAGNFTRLQRRLEFFESLMPILNTMELLRHRQYV